MGRFDAFICYKREDGHELAKLIEEALVKKGIECYRDLSRDQLGQFPDYLEKEIKKAPNFILIESKKVFSGCEDENDWVRKEVLLAIKLNKKIIPVRTEKFKWSKKLKEYLPDKMKQLETQQEVEYSITYFDAMVEKITEYITDIKNWNIYDTRQITALQFIEEAFHKGRKIQSIDMVFHAGAEWHWMAEKAQLRDHLIEQKIPLRIIINAKESVEFIQSYLRNPSRSYEDMDDSISKWKTLEKDNPEIVSVRVSEIPILHRMYIVRYSDTEGSADIKYYTYGNYLPAKDFRVRFDSDNEKYQLYAAEFDYLWKRVEGMYKCL